MKKLILNIVACSILYSGLVFAGDIKPDLQRALQSMSPEQEISVIITFSDKADIKGFRGKDKGVRRSEIITALKNKADMTQGHVKSFLGKRGVKKMLPLWIVNGMAVTASTGTVKELAGQPGVESIGLDRLLSAPVVTYGEATAPEWNLTAIHAPELWNLGYNGSGIVVANMDTGVDAEHADLAVRWRGGDNSWYDPNGEHDAPFDKSGHGTQTMSIMAGGNAGGTAIGVAPGAKWIAVKVFNDAGYASYSAIHQGFQWLLDPDGNPDTNDSPDVVNISWGLDNIDACALDFQPDIQALKSSEIAVSFAAGNYGPGSSTSISPANYPESFAAGSVDQNLAIDSGSSRGPSACDGGIFPEVVAPGVNVKTADLTLGGISPYSYAFVSGTSFAAPHLSGAEALLLSIFPWLTVSDLESALTNSTMDIGEPGADNEYGYGFLDVYGAYNSITASVPDISASPVSIDFGKARSFRTSVRRLTITNRGSADLVVTKAEIEGADAGMFRVVNSTSVRTIGADMTDRLTVTFRPGSTGIKTVLLRIYSSDPDTPVVAIPVQGGGI